MKIYEKQIKKHQTQLRCNFSVNGKTYDCQASWYLDYLTVRKFIWAMVGKEDKVVEWLSDALFYDVDLARELEGKDLKEFFQAYSEDGRDFSWFDHDLIIYLYGKDSVEMGIWIEQNAEEEEIPDYRESYTSFMNREHPIY